ncbi:dihydrofolate reductase-like domain-containing protein [Tuber borchii]|uniref:Dihydrofolate reductase n=1 Tax=Tuber borchii TaxID=42251 RepID=A0A2T6ZJT1_TUBBO|nr:dihydrofolate reductase-like domain-containing protein [Tuber borchii]
MTTQNINLTIIVAATHSLGIGKSGTLPWHLPRDLSYFSRVTKRPSPPTNPALNTLIMGRKTYLSIPPKSRPLPSRRNIVISRFPRPDSFNNDGSTWVTSFPDAIAAAAGGDGGGGGRIFVIGGAEIYKLAMEDERTRNVLLTSVEGEFGCDTFFPVDVRDEENTGWARRRHEELCAFVGEEVPAGVREENGVRFWFELYQRL